MYLTGVVPMLAILGNPFLTNAATGREDETTECLSNKDCSSDRLCAEWKCINPCLLNLCDDPRNCKVANHIPICSCKAGFSGVLAGASQPQTPVSRPRPTFSEPPQLKGKKKFKLITVIRVNWYLALAQCNANNMQLASVENQEEYNTVVTMIKQANLRTGNFWTSGTDLGTLGQWLWITKGRSMTWADWFDGEPNHNSHYGEVERCVMINHRFQYRMNDYICSDPNFFICEYYD